MIDSEYRHFRKEFMSRLVKHTAVGPAEVKTKNGDSVWVCRCGLTSHEDGTCSSNHKKFKVTEEEKGKLYQYDADGNRSEVTGVCVPGEDCECHGEKKSHKHECEECEHCCGGGCCDED